MLLVYLKRTPVLFRRATHQGLLLIAFVNWVIRASFFSLSFFFFFFFFIFSFLFFLNTLDNNAHCVFVSKARSIIVQLPFHEEECVPRLLLKPVEHFGAIRLVPMVNSASV